MSWHFMLGRFGFGLLWSYLENEGGVESRVSLKELSYQHAPVGKVLKTSRAMELLLHLFISAQFPAWGLELMSFVH